METLTLNGKRYVKASKAAKDYGYASDYVGQLCRTGAVDAHLVGRTWYVNPDMLSVHRIEKKRNSRAKAREYAKKSIEETRALHIKQDTKRAGNIGIRYQHDGGRLIPEVRKVSIVSEKQLVEDKIDESKDLYTIENKDKKVVMSGPIHVYDADEETKLTDTIILKPRIVRRSTNRTMIRDVEKIGLDHRKSADFTNQNIGKPISSFSEKLAEQDETTEYDAASQSAEIKVEEDTGFAKIESSRNHTKQVMRATLTVVFLALTIIAFVSTVFEGTIDYTSNGSTEFGYRIDVSDIRKLASKI
jgi:hypothetical protein